MNKLVRPKDGIVVAGVCAALAHRFNISVSVVRLIAVLSIILPGTQVLIYGILWILIPKEA